MYKKRNDLIIVRGGGDIATGTIYKLYKSGFSVLILEIEKPSAIRRKVSFSEAVYDGTQKVEDVTCYFAKDLEEAKLFLKEGRVTLLVDPLATAIAALKPSVVVDAILAKRNLGTTKDMAPLTIALGPGFCAGTDVDVVVETMRGHSLGRLIYQGCPIANTGIPGSIAGVFAERVIHAKAGGILHSVSKITDIVEQGQVIATIESKDGNIDVTATIRGLLRGMIRDGFLVYPGLKIADIDPRISEYNNCFTISDKARCIAGGVLEAVMQRKSKEQE